jgi:hypothetical protein
MLGLQGGGALHAPWTPWLAMQVDAHGTDFFDWNESYTSRLGRDRVRLLKSCWGNFESLQMVGNSSSYAKSSARLGDPCMVGVCVSQAILGCRWRLETFEQARSISKSPAVQLSRFQRQLGQSTWSSAAGHLGVLLQGPAAPAPLQTPARAARCPNLCTHCPPTWQGMPQNTQGPYTKW